MGAPAGRAQEEQEDFDVASRAEFDREQALAHPLLPGFEKTKRTVGEQAFPKPTGS